MSTNTKSQLSSQNCPICDKTFNQSEIEKHVNKCIFLNSTNEHEEQQKRKRSISPVLSSVKQKSPQTVISSPTKKLKDEKTAAFLHPTTSNSTQNKNEVNEFREVWGEKDAKNKHNFTPLAKQLQPKLLDDFYGQNHVLGKNTVLRTLLEKGEIPNMILWGPPGCGKTSLSNVIHEMCKANPNKYKFVPLCAATCGTKDVQNTVSAAKLEMKFGRRTILFMDEIHRFNKRQQDVFLLHVEKGEIVLIGATTENPSFALNSALLSRCRVIVMQKLEPEDLFSILEHAAARLNIDVVDSDPITRKNTSENW